MFDLFTELHIPECAARLRTDNANARLGAVSALERQIGGTFGLDYMRFGSFADKQIDQIIRANRHNIIFTRLGDRYIELRLMIPGARGTLQITLGQAGGLVN